jgi:serine/threonine-protein kinase
MSFPPAIELRPDSIVGSYRIVREIGCGGMGSVFEAMHVVLPRRAALKVMHPELRRQPGMATRIVQEASILEDVRHPGIARVFDCSLLADHRPWIAMELVEGETLAARLLRHAMLPAQDVATLLANVGDVLASVHAHDIVHRDLKPDNLILTPRDRDFPLRVIDWGVARLGPLGRLTLDGLTPGTPIYMSPEQAAGRDIAAPCDVYSLGVIGYEALAGHPPFDGRTLAEVVCMHLSGDPPPLRARSGAPPALCRLVHRMLNKDPAVRPSAVEVRRVARAVALDLSTAYESFELVRDDVRPAASEHPTIDSAAPAVDADALEYGVTELLPTIRRPRWTPELAARVVPTNVADDELAATKK